MHYGYEVANQVFRHGGYPPMGGRGGAGIPFHGIGPLPVLGHLMATIFIVGLGVLVWYFVTHRSHRPALAGGLTQHQAMPQPDMTSAPTGPDAAESIVRERLARGEITAEEYSAIIEALRRQG